MRKLLDNDKHMQSLEKKEALIEESKRIFVTTVDKDLIKLDKLNKILGNGIALYLVAAVGKH